MEAPGERAAGLGVGVYRGALRLLPPGLRREYAAEMVRDLAHVLRARQAVPGRVAATARAVADVVLRAPTEWRDELKARRSSSRAGREGWGGSGGAREIRLAVRGLLRRPGYALAAVATLALGIGATVAIWTVVESVLLRPLPYPNAERLVTVRHAAPGWDLPELGNSVGTLRLYEEQARTLAGVAATEVGSRNLSGGSEPVRVQIAQVSRGFFDVLGVGPALGGRFRESDMEPGPARAVILLDGAWRQHFGGDPAMVGSTVRIDGQPAEVVGVMPPGFRMPDGRDVALLLPLPLDPSRGLTTFGMDALMLLAPGETVESARAELVALQPRLGEVIPDFTPEMLSQVQWAVEVDALQARLVQPVARTLWILLGTVGLVLLIAFANVTNLVLVRAESRRRELAIREALGAGRRSILGTFLAETMLLALTGGAIGLALAWATVRLVVTHGPQGLPRLHEISMDGSVMAIAAATSVVLGLLLALVPHAGRMFATSLDTLRDGGARSTGGREGVRTRGALIALQVAMALVLLVFAGLLVRSSLRLAALDPGIRTDGVLVVAASRGAGESAEEAAIFYQRVLDGIAALPGVERVGASSYVPFNEGNMNGSNVRIESRPRADDGEPTPIVMFAAVTEGVFEALGMRLLEGRPVERADHELRRPVVWVNATFARRLLDGRTQGERVRFGGDTTWLEIAGVVDDVRTFGLENEVRSMAYLPMTTTVDGVSLELMQYAVRTESPHAAVGAAIRDVVRGIDAATPVAVLGSLDQAMRNTLAQRSFTLLLLAMSAGAALLLGIVGLYGVISYVVSQRTREIGVRIALGADMRRVSEWVLRHGLRLVVAGVLIGLLIAAAAARLLSSLLFGVDAHDPVTYAAVVLLLLGVGAAATWVPARRAARVSPLEALRAD